MYKLVKKDEAIQRQISPNYKANNFITKETSVNISLAVTEATDFKEAVTPKENRIYYVLEGELHLNFDGEKIIVKAGDSCFISEGTTYILEGTFKSVIVNQPAFGMRK